MWLTIAILSLLLVFVTPSLKDSKLRDRLIGAGIATLSLGWFYSRARRWRLRSLAKRIAGEWTYITFPHDLEKRPGNYGFGLMHFFVDDTNELRYRVELFGDAKSLSDSVKYGSSAPGAVGRAHDRAFRYDPDENCIWLIYKVTYNQPDRKDRTGHLYIDFSNHKRPQGYWASDLDKLHLSAGEMHICRPPEFDKLIASFEPFN